MNRKTKICIAVAAAVCAVVVAVIVVALFTQGSGRKYDRHLKLAKQYLEELNYEQAIAELRAAIKIDPKNREAYRKLAEVYVEMEDYENAIEVLQTGIAEAGGDELEEYLMMVQSLLEMVQTEGEAESVSGSPDQSTGGKTEPDTEPGAETGDGTETGDPSDAESQTASGEENEAGRQDGEDGRTLTVEEIADARVGDIVIFGSYEQDNNPDNGKEPIEWHVLENDGEQVTLLSVCVLDTELYDGMEYDDILSENWETCTVRSKLNNEFYQTAFTEAEQAGIAVTHVKNGYDALSEKDGGNDTEDKVWLLSYEEIERYFGIPMTQETNPFYNHSIDDWDEYALYCYEKDHRIIGNATAYAQARGVATTSVEEFYPSHALSGGCWLLRSPGDFGVSAHVYGDGATLWYGGFGIVEGYNNGIRPAIKLAY